MPRVAVFAYGSLVDPASAAPCFEGRCPPAVPATLPGWRRRWSVVRDNRRCEKTFAVRDTGRVPARVLGLNVERRMGLGGSGGPNGFLYEVGAVALSRLDRRELRYRRVDVGGEVACRENFDVVWVYTAKPHCLAALPPRDAIVIAGYVARVESAFRLRGGHHLSEFRRTTERPPVPVVEAVLIRDRIPMGNPRAW